MNISGKKLLILGGTRLMVHVVEIAKELEVYTVVTDMEPNSPAKLVCDKAYNISTSEIDEVVAMAREEKIDGVFVGYDDQNTGFAVEICRNLNIPFYATREQINITKNKILFKNMCKINGIPVVQDYTLNNIEFPCVVKPADSYSAKGITICFNKNEVNDAIQFAKEYSKSNQYLIEKYMDYSTADCVNIDYLLVDGEIILTMVGDKLVIKQGNKAPLTDAVIYPSKHVREYIDYIDSNMKTMFKKLGMKNGVVFIESFFSKNGFAIYEMGYRVGGGQSSILLNSICGVDYIKFLINFSLTGKMTDKVLPKINPSEIDNSCGLVVLVKAGKIAQISGIEEIRKIPEVVNITQYLYVGDTLDSKFLGTLGQTFARIHIVGKSKENMLNAMREIREILSVIDEHGQEMIIESNRIINTY